MELNPSARHNLPPEPTTFIGRADEVARITALLRDPACRLLTLVGMGGIGKTRLALAAAAHLLDDFPDGVYYVPLQSLTAHTDVLPVVADAIQLRFFGQTDPLQQLLSHLNGHRVLLVLDSFEHLLEGVDLLVAILAGAPGVRLLVTSRERLRLLEEWTFEVSGLTFPEDERAGSLEDYSAIQLFVHHARRATNRFSPSAEDWTAITRICRLVEGMPLAIEMAASWARTLTCAEIADQIGHGQDILTATARNAPEAHRSMRTVFDRMWRLLTDAERVGFSKLAIFQGEFRREAAEMIAGVSLPLLD